MKLRERYTRLTLWNKIGFWGSVASVLSVGLWIYDRTSSLSDRSSLVPIVGVSPSPMVVPHNLPKQPKKPEPQKSPALVKISKPKNTEVITPEKRARAADRAVVQNMINSPGGIQALGNVNITRERPVIHSLTLDLWFEQLTTAQSPGESQTDMGLQSGIALFTPANHRLRFVSNWRIEASKLRRMSAGSNLHMSPKRPLKSLDTRCLR